MPKGVHQHRRLHVVGRGRVRKEVPQPVRGRLGQRRGLGRVQAGGLCRGGLLGRELKEALERLVQRRRVERPVGKGAAIPS